MKGLHVASLLGAMLLFLTSGSAWAEMVEITAYDENSKRETGWHGKIEDNEVEPGMERSQAWDLEAFYVEKSAQKIMLEMVGGYDFMNGQRANGHTYTAGDVFIDIDGNAEYGDIHNHSTDNSMSVKDTFGYDYVLDMNWSAKTYDILRLSPDSSTLTAYYAQNQGSNPWLYDSGGETIETGLSFDYTYFETYNGLLGIGHNVVGMDISFLLDEEVPYKGYFTASNTMECGNDNLIGVSPAPEPATMLLFGTGLAGLIGRRIRRKK
ncbi:MAG: PEP-CTERM sorting domain-containing protein [Desulforhopalus sp.]